jgi:hypothetical protein
VETKTPLSGAALFASFALLALSCSEGDDVSHHPSSRQRPQIGQPDLAEPEMQALRSKFRICDSDPLWLTKPVEVVYAGYTRAGHIYVSLKGSEGQTLVAWHYGPTPVRVSFGQPLGDIYLGVQPPQPGSRALEDTDPRKAALYGLLIRWAESHPWSGPLPQKATQEERTLYFAHWFLILMDWQFIEETLTN